MRTNKLSIGTALLYFFILLFQISYAYSQPSNITKISQSGKKTSQNESNEILRYIDSKLKNAGFSKDSREYVLSVTTKRISEIGIPESFNKDLINSNLYSLIENLPIKDQQAAIIISKQLNQASIHKKPWDYLLETKQLEFFNSRSVFNSISKLEVEGVILGLCPIWPFCKGDDPEKKKHIHKPKRAEQWQPQLMN